MVLVLKQLARLAAQKLASDPKAREKAVKTAQQVAKEARNISAEPDKARAAGKAFSKVLRTYRRED